jgi:anthranilate phosphoribosyltransferase
MNFGPNNLHGVIRKLVSRMNLSQDEITQTINLILQGEASEADIASFLVALTMKGESTDEIRTILQIVKKYAIRIAPQVNGCLIDNCGTGGDIINSFNISTASAIIASSAGTKIAKHGNRSVSGLCGSADFMEYIGMDLNRPVQDISAAIEHTGIGFLYAPKFHPAMQNVASARRTIGIRTIFNILGPLSNPCTNLYGQLVGVSEPKLLKTMALVMQNSDIQEVMLVHALDGFDELSNTCENIITWIIGKEVKNIRLHPRDMNIELAKSENLIIRSKEDSVRDTLQVIYGVSTKEKQDIAVLNASAALVVGKVAVDFREGVEIAREVIKAGRAQKKLLELIQRCGRKDMLRAAERKFLT